MDDDGPNQQSILSVYTSSLFFFFFVPGLSFSFFWLWLLQVAAAADDDDNELTEKNAFQQNDISFLKQKGQESYRGERMEWNMKALGPHLEVVVNLSAETTKPLWKNTT